MSVLAIGASPDSAIQAVAGVDEKIVMPVVRTPKAPSSSRPARANRPTPLLLNFEARSPTPSALGQSGGGYTSAGHTSASSTATVAVTTPASCEKDRSPKSARRRPPALVSLSSKVTGVDSSFVSQCDHLGGAKSRPSRPFGEAHHRSGTPSTSDTNVEVRSLVAQALTPQPGSEGASTTASSSSEWCDLQEPEELEYVRRLGQGSSGTVEKHRHLRTGKEIALKIINASNIAEPQRKAILLELRTFNRCRNPHIVDFFGCFFHENNIHIGLEYMDAGALSSVLEIRGTVPENLMANVTWQVLDGLEYLHSQMHVIHRDIKPSNLLLSSSGDVKITDFGVSGELEERLGESTGKVTWVGTIYYMSPERAQGHVYKYDSDMWSLGLTLIECLCGRFPYLESETSYKQLSFWELMRRIVEQEAPRLPAGYGNHVQDFIQQVLQKEPRNRAGAAMMKAHAWFNDAAKQAELVAWIEQSGVVGEPQVAASPSASIADECRRVVFSPSPAKSRSSRAGQLMSELDFVNVSPADSTPMNTSLRGGANPFMPCLTSSDCPQVTTPSDRSGRIENPFAQFAPALEGSAERAMSSRSFLHKGSGSETPMDRSMRNGENPFLVRGGTSSPFPEAQSPLSVCSGTPQCKRGLGFGVEASPMAQSLRTGGDNPFLQRLSSSDAPMSS